MIKIKVSALTDFLKNLAPEDLLPINTSSFVCNAVKFADTRHDDISSSDRARIIASSTDKNNLIKEICLGGDAVTISRVFHAGDIFHVVASNKINLKKNVEVYYYDAEKDSSPLLLSIPPNNFLNESMFLISFKRNVIPQIDKNKKARLMFVLKSKDGKNGTIMFDHEE